MDIDDREPKGGQGLLSSQLWSRDFSLYWSALSVSGLGTGVSMVVVPILAATALGATPTEIGLLRAAETVPYLVLALWAGLLADAFNPKALMLLSDATRAALTALIPLLLSVSMLNLPVLAVIVLLIGCFTVVFDVAQFALLPSLLPDRARVSGNSVLELTRGAASTFGPGLGGWLAGVVRPATAVLADSASYVFSFLALLPVRTPLQVRPPDGDREPALVRLRSGASVVFGDRLLRPMTVYLGVNNLLTQAFLTALIAFLTVQEKSSAQFIGLCFGLYGAGLMVGALVAPRTSRLGAGRTVVASSVIGGAGLLIVAAGFASPALLALVPAGTFTGGLVAPLFNVHSVVLRLSLTPKEMLGSVTSLVKLISQGRLAVGAMMGGLLISVGPGTPTFILLGILSLTATAILACSPVRAVRDMSSMKQ
jgi:MFS family permease